MKQPGYWLYPVRTYADAVKRANKEQFRGFKTDIQGPSFKDSPPFYLVRAWRKRHETA